MKKRFLKGIGLILVTAMAMSVLSGCGSKDAETAKEGNNKIEVWMPLTAAVSTLCKNQGETPLAKESISATEKLAASTKLYSKGAGKFSGIAKRFMGKPISPERIGALIVKALLKKRPRPTYSKHRNPGLILLGVLPIGLQCRIIKMLLK